MTLAPIADGVSLAAACDYPFRAGLIAQEKIDGVRAWLDCDTGQLTGRNTPQGFLDGSLPAGCVLDGELVKDTFHAFDLLRLNGQDVRGEQDTDCQALARRVNNRGGEGIVVKHAGMSYHRRSWTRCKREMTLDVCIVSVDRLKQSAEVSLAGKSLGRIFGFNGREIEQAAPGMVCEVRAIQFTEAGKLRSGRFLKFRKDKVTA